MEIFQYNDIKRRAENCPSRGEIAHCWHRGSVTYTSNPSQHDETCCFCGRIDRIIDPPSSLSGGVSYNPSAHGPHYQVTSWNLTPDGSASWRVIPATNSVAVSSPRTLTDGPLNDQEAT